MENAAALAKGEGRAGSLLISKRGLGSNELWGLFQSKDNKLGILPMRKSDGVKQ